MKTFEEVQEQMLNCCAESPDKSEGEWLITDRHSKKFWGLVKEPVEKLSAVVALLESRKIPKKYVMDTEHWNELMDEAIALITLT